MRRNTYEDYQKVDLFHIFIHSMIVLIMAKSKIKPQIECLKEILLFTVLWKQSEAGCLQAHSWKVEPKETKKVHMPQGQLQP